MTGSNTSDHSKLYVIWWAHWITGRPYTSVTLKLCIQTEMLPTNKLTRAAIFIAYYSSSWLRSLASLFVTTMSSCAARSTISLRLRVETLWAISAQYVLFTRNEDLRIGIKHGHCCTKLASLKMYSPQDHITVKKHYLLCIISNSRSETLWTTNFLNLLGR